LHSARMLDLKFNRQCVSGMSGPSRSTSFQYRKRSRISRNLMAAPLRG
jgi:hypothetical protein